MEIQKSKADAEIIYDMQILLLEAHDIVGISGAVFSKTDVMTFDGIDLLYAEYELHSKAWELALEAKNIRRSLLSCTLSSCNCYDYQLRVKMLFSSFQTLLNDILHNYGDATVETIPRTNPTTMGPNLQLLATKIVGDMLTDFKPKLECIIYLSFKSFKLHHWKRVAFDFFSCCRLGLMFDSVHDKLADRLLTEYIRLQDISGGAMGAIDMGPLSDVSISTLMFRNVSKYNGEIRSIAGEAYVEAIIEKTLLVTEAAVKSVNIYMSSDWLNDPRFREKTNLSIARVTNLMQLNVILQYSIKSICILQYTTLDMNLTIFSKKLQLLLDLLLKMNKFVCDMVQIQNDYYYIFRFMKMSFRSSGVGLNEEVDRDAMRLFDNITTDYKLMESLLRGSNFYERYSAISMKGITTEHLKENLSLAIETIQSNFQSMYDACPRLSLISYTSLNNFSALWLLDPSDQIDLVNDYMHQMFEGVGSLLINKNVGKRQQLCVGFVAIDKSEVVEFPEPIPMKVNLADFVMTFERNLRETISSTADVLISMRIQALRSLLLDASTVQILDSLVDVFKQRWSQLSVCFTPSRPNQSFIMINQCVFAEDVWFCFGHFSGSFNASFSEAPSVALFTKAWKNSIRCLIEICEENLQLFTDSLDPEERLLVARMAQSTMSSRLGIGWNSGQHHVKDAPVNSTSLSSAKEFALYSSFYLQELQNLTVLNELLVCDSIENAIEVWASRFQLRYVFSKADRVKNSVFDITMGCTTISHCMEYRGGFLRPFCHPQTEQVLHHVISAACYRKGSAVVLHDNTSDEKVHIFSDPKQIAPSLFDARDEYAVTANDIAYALGRILCPISDMVSSSACRLFLSRLLLLDAVGCVDFTSIDYNGLQILQNGMNAMYGSIEKKDEYFVEESIKYPLKGRMARSDLQTQRRNDLVADYRSHYKKLISCNCFNNMIVMGMASDTIYSSSSVFEYATRNMFSAVSVENDQPIASMKAMLAIHGFQFSGEIQNLFAASIQGLFSYSLKLSETALINDKQNSLVATSLIDRVCKSLVSSRVIVKLLKCAAETLLCLILSSDYQSKHRRAVALEHEQILKISKETKAQNKAQSSVPFSGQSPKKRKSFEGKKSGGKTARERLQEQNKRVREQEHLSHSTVHMSLRLEAEIVCFGAALWDIILELLVQCGLKTGSASAAATHCTVVDIVALKNVVCKPMQALVDSSLSNLSGCYFGKNNIPKTPLALLIGDNSIAIPSQMKSLIEKISQDFDISFDGVFVQQCVSLWSLLASGRSEFISPSSLANGRIIGVTGATGCGKSTIIDVVLKAIEICEKTPSNILLCNSPILLPWKAAHIILNCLLHYRFKLKNAVKEKLHHDKIKMMYGESECKIRSSVFHPKYDNSSNLAIEKVRALHCARSAAVRSKKGRTTSDGAAPTPQIASFSPSEQFLERSTVYCNSLSLEALIGTYDRDGHWNDGLLLRKLRCIAHERAKLLLSPKEASALHVIVIDGIIGHSIEQLFLPSVFLQHSQLNVFPGCNEHIVYPCAEYARISDNTIILLESADISNISPLFVSVLPQIHVQVVPEVHLQRILRVWMRNISCWLGRFPPWIDVVDDLNDIILNSSYVSDILYHVQAESAMSTTKQRIPGDISLLNSQISTFLRIMEDLLQVCHDLAITADKGTFVVDEEAYIEGNESSSDSDSSDEGEASIIEPDESWRNFAPTVFSLDAAGRIKLAVRVRMSLVYASVWGLGGIYNSTSKRLFFDNILRNAVEKHLDNDDFFIELPHHTSVFDMHLLLHEMTFSPASYETATLCGLSLGSSDVYSATKLRSDIMESMPRAQQSNVIDAEMVTGINIDVENRGVLTESSPKALRDVMYHTPTQLAVAFALRSVLRSGGNAILFGPRSGGKSYLINRMLGKLRSKCPTPSSMRADIMRNLQTLVCDLDSSSKVSNVGADQSIPRSLSNLRTVLETMANDTSYGFKGDDLTSFAHHWTEAVAGNSDSSTDGLEASKWSIRESAEHINAETVHSSCVSVAVADTADKLRSWLCGELKTEVTNLLEPPMYTYGVVFVDDVHLANYRESKELSSGNISNRVDSLLKGLLSGTPIFGTRKHAKNYIKKAGVAADMFNDFSKVIVPDTKISLKELTRMPTMHMRSNTDPRHAVTASLYSQTKMENYIMKPLSFIAAATGDFDSMYGNGATNTTGENDSAISSSLPYFCCLSLPAASIEDIHCALIVSTYGCLAATNFRMSNNESSQGVRLVDSLKLKVLELCKYTTSIWSSMFRIISPAPTTNSVSLDVRNLSVSPVEKSITTASLPTFGSISKFCTYLHAGGAFLSNPCDLLNLWVHEWKKMFLDNLPPDCEQRNRVVDLIKHQLDSVDVVDWKITGDVIRKLNASLTCEELTGWLPVQVLKLSNFAYVDYVTMIPVDTDDCKMTPSYRPLTLDVKTTSEFICTTVWNSEEGRHGACFAGSKADNDSGSVVCNSIVDATIHFNSNYGDCHALFYPQGICMIMRLVRILSMNNVKHDSGAHIDSHRILGLLLLGFPGSTKLIALQLAARICNMELMTFDIKHPSSGLVEQAPSDRSHNFNNFQLFLKKVILRVSGFSYVSGGEANNRNVIDCAEDTYELLTGSTEKNKRVLMVVTGVTGYLSDEEKRMLYSVMHRNVPMHLFSDGELCSMLNCLRREMLEKVSRDAAEAQMLNSTVMNKTCIEEPLVSRSAPVPGNSHKEDQSSAAVAPLLSPVLPPTIVSPLVMPTTGISTCAESVKYASVLYTSLSLTGYSYGWIKNYLYERMSGYLNIALDGDISRAYQLVPTVAAVGLNARKSSARSANEAHKGSGAKDRRDSQRPSIRQSRFSVISSKPLSSDTGSVSADRLKGQTKEADPVAPTETGLTGVDGDTVLANDTVVSGKNVVKEISRMKEQGYLSIYCCPILGPCVTKMQTVWYDIESHDAIHGVCNALMRNVAPSMEINNLSRNISCAYGSIPNNVLSDLHTTDMFNVHKASISSMVFKARSSHSVKAVGDGERRKLGLIRESEDDIDENAFKASIKDCEHIYKIDAFSINCKNSEKSEYDQHRSPLFEHLGWISSIGVVGAFRKSSNCVKLEGEWDNHSLHDFKKCEAIDRKLPFTYREMLFAMKEEARAILPHLLSMKLPVDNIVYTKPVFIQDMEHIAARSAEIGMLLLEEGGSVLLKRRCSLKIVHDALKESLGTLHNITSLQKALARSIGQTTKALRNSTNHVSECLKEMEEFSVAFRCTSTYESNRMLREEMISVDASIMLLQSMSEDILLQVRQEVQSLTSQQLHEFCTRYASLISTGVSNPAAVILIRGVMLLLNYTIAGGKESMDKQNSFQSTNPGSGRHGLVPIMVPSAGGTWNTSEVMSDEQVGKHAVGVLTSNELSFSLCSLIPSMFEKSGGLEPLRYANSLLRAYVAFDVEETETESSDNAGGGLLYSSSHPADVLKNFPSPSIYSVMANGKANLAVVEPAVTSKKQSRGKKKKKKNLVPSNEMNLEESVVFNSFKSYLECIEIYCDTQHHISRLKCKLLELEKEYEECTHEESNLYLSEETRLKGLVDAAKEDLHFVDSELLRKKILVDQLRQVSDKKDAYLEQCNSSLDYVSQELLQVDSILKCFVADVCVAVAVFGRASAQREQIRQECMEVFRNDLRLRLGSDFVSSSPYILGSLLDRLQVRHWTSGHIDTLPRDAASINAASLLYLSPMYTYVFDPEGVVESAIADMLPCDICTTTVFETRSKATCKVTTVPSFELFSVSAQKFSLAHLEAWLQHAMERHRSMDINVTMLVTDVHAGSSDDLIAFLSAPVHIVEPDWHDSNRCKHNGHRELNNKVAARKKPFVVLNFSNDPVLSNCDGFHIALTPVFKVILLSTTLPTLDPVTNICSPLPLCCFRKVDIIHWSCSGACVTDWYEENESVSSQALGETNVGDCIYESKMVETLCSKVAPDLHNQNFLINGMIIDTTAHVYGLENSVVSVVEHWANLQPRFLLGSSGTNGSLEKAENEDSVEEFNLGFLTDAVCSQVLNDSFLGKEQPQLELEVWKSLEREIHSYFGAISEVFSMTIDVLRMATVTIPSCHLVPYCLTAKAVCVNGILPLFPVTNSKISNKTANLSETDKNMIFLLKQVPPSLVKMANLYDAVSALQRKFRNSRAKQPRLNASGARPQIRPLSSATIVQNCRETEAVLAFRKSHNRKSASGGALTMDEVKSNFLNRIGFNEEARKTLTECLHVLLVPLKLPIMYSVVNYLHKSVCPGYEWLVKFTVFSAVMMQNRVDPSHFKLKSYGTGQSGGVNHAELRMLLQLWARNNAGLYNNNKIYYSNVYRMRYLTTALSDSAEDQKVSKGREVFDEDVNTAAFSNLPSVNRIKCGYVPIDLSITDIRGTNEGQLPKKSRNRASPHSSDAVATPAVFARKAAGKWTSRGPGRLDGVWLNRYSLKWKIKSSVMGDIVAGRHGSSSELGMTNRAKVGAPLLRHSIVSCDSLAPDIVSKDIHIDCSRNDRDSFMAEWFHLHGVQIGSVSNMCINSLSVIDPSHVCKTLVVDERSNAMDSHNSKLDSIKIALQRRASTRASFNCGLPMGFGSKSDLTNRNDSDSNASRPPESGGRSRLAALSGNSIESSPATARTSVIRSSVLMSSRQSIASTVSDSVGVGTISFAPSKLSMMMSGLGASRRPSMASKYGSGARESCCSSGLNRKSLGGRRISDLTLNTSLHSILDNENSKQLSMIVEQHSALCDIFCGLNSVAFEQYADDLLQWKSRLLELSRIPFNTYSTEELCELIKDLTPPIIDEDDDDGNITSEGLPKGLWVRGRELSINQTLILATIVAPQSVSCLLEVVFVLIALYLKNGGILLNHPDEACVAIDNDSSSDESDCDSDEDFSFNKNTIEEVDEENSEDSFHCGSKRKKPLGCRHQRGLLPINSWSKLSEMLSGKRPTPVARYSMLVSKYKLTCRDYENWESILLDTLTSFVDTPVDKFSYAAKMRDSVSGVRSSVFLLPVAAGADVSMTSCSSVLASVSQRAREVAMYNNKYVPIFNCSLVEHGFHGKFSSVSEDSYYASKASHGGRGSDIGRSVMEVKTTAARSRLVELIKAAKNATVSVVQKRAVIENVSFITGAGNALLFAVLQSFMTGSSSSIGSYSASQNGALDKTNGDSLSADGVLVSRSILAQSEMLEKALARKEKGQILVSKKYPLIVTGKWEDTYSMSRLYGNYLDALKSPLCFTSDSLLMNAHSNTLSNSPLSFLHSMDYAWIPKHQCIDIIATSVSAKETSSVSENEACGVLYEELESNLVWTMNTFRQLVKSNLTTAIRNRFKFAKKIESRVVSGLLCIYKLCLYTELKEQEFDQGLASKDIPILLASWTKCIEPINFWQLSRLLLNSSRILNNTKEFCDESGIVQCDVPGIPETDTRERLVNNSLFKREVAVCSNTFLTFLSAPAMYESQSNLGILRYSGLYRRDISGAVKSIGAPGCAKVTDCSPSALAKRRSVVFPSNAAGFLRAPPPSQNIFSPNQLTPRPPSATKPPTSSSRSRGASESDGAQNAYRDAMDVLLNLQQCNTKMTSNSLAFVSAEEKPVLRTRANSSCPIKNTRRFNSMVGIYLAYICECLMKDDLGVGDNIRTKLDTTTTSFSATSTAPILAETASSAGSKPGLHTSRHSISLGFRTAVINNEEAVASKKTANKIADESYAAIDRTTLIQEFDCNIVVGGLTENDTIIGIARWTVDGMYEIDIGHEVPVDNGENDGQPGGRNRNRMSDVRKKGILSKLRRSILKTSYEESALTASFKDVFLEASKSRNLVAASFA